MGTPITPARHPRWRLGARILGAWSSGPGERELGSSGPLPGIPLRALGDGVDTDRGELTALSAPGYARDHLVFHWRDQRAAFVGDLLLGAGETTWVGGYSGCVADYFASLDRVDNLGAGVLLPDHGPPVFDPEARLGRYRAHRRERVTQVERALTRGRRSYSPLSTESWSPRGSCRWRV
jgi:glyoxylase-like metal-dependent hydrolase (beta-lactamase superfamily II)